MLQRAPRAHFGALWTVTFCEVNGLTRTRGRTRCPLPGSPNTYSYPLATRSISSTSVSLSRTLPLSAPRLRSSASSRSQPAKSTDGCGCAASSGETAACPPPLCRPACSSPAAWSCSTWLGFRVRARARVRVGVRVRVKVKVRGRVLDGVVQQHRGSGLGCVGHVGEDDPSRASLEPTRDVQALIQPHAAARTAARASSPRRAPLYPPARVGDHAARLVEGRALERRRAVPHLVRVRVRVSGQG